MNRGYLPAVVTYLAAFITCLSCVLNHREVNESLVLILVVMVVFFIIGTIAKEIIDYTLSKTIEDEEEETMNTFNQEVLGEKQDNIEHNYDATE